MEMYAEIFVDKPESSFVVEEEGNKVLSLQSGIYHA